MFVCENLYVFVYLVLEVAAPARVAKCRAAELFANIHLHSREPAAHQRHCEPITKLRPNLNKALAQLVTDCIAPNPDNRPESIGAFIKRLQKVKAEEQ